MRPLHRIPHAASEPHASSRPVTTRWRGLTILLAGLGLVALLAGCGVTPGAKSIPTAAPLPQLHLHWQPMTMPPGNSVIPYTLGFAPSDGDTVYACNVAANASSQQLHLWVTHDRSAHWTHLADLTVHAGSNQCTIVVDEWQPTIAIVAVTWAPMGASPGLSSYASYATLDGGATWHQLTGPYPYLVRQLATIAGVTYADLSIQLPGSGGDELATSNDGLRTWQPLPQTQTFGLGNGNSGFWLDPKTGALLIEGTPSAGTSLWRSDDRDMHWTQVMASPALTDPSAVVLVQTPQAGASWHLCIATSPGDGRTPSNSLTCSLDGGQTWSARPGLNVAFNNPSKGTFYAPTDVFAIDDSGAVLADVSVSDFTNNTIATTLYRLAPQARQWQRIGSYAGQAFPIELYSTASGDILWADGQPVIGESSLPQGWFFAPYPPPQP